MQTIQLTRGYTAVIDDIDYASIICYKWYAKIGKKPHAQYVYAARSLPRVAGKRSTQRMHQAILPVPVGYTVDHINGNTLDNTRQNLRSATKAQQQQNAVSHIKPGLKGITKRRNRWVARIGRNGNTFLGAFTEKEAAIIAYNKAAQTLYASFANLNPLQEN